MTVEELEALMLSGEPFTYGSMCGAYGGSRQDDGRVVDKTIQRLRKKGLIAFKREKGNGVVWRATKGQNNAG